MRFTNPISITTLLMAAFPLSSSGQEVKKAPGTNTEQAKPDETPAKGQSAAAKETKAPNKILVVVEEPFKKTIGQFSGFEQVGPSYIVRPGWNLRIAMTSSGGKKVDWKLLKAAGHGLLGEQSLETGDRKTIWTNNTGKPVEVIFEADPDAFVDVRITGKFASQEVKRAKGANKADEAKASDKAKVLVRAQFKKTIGQFSGSEQVGPSYIVRPGWNVEVAMTSSGGKSVDWEILKAAGHGSLGDVHLQAGDRKTIWTNNTGKPVEVIFEADPNALVDVRVTGEFDSHRVKQ